MLKNLLFDLGGVIVDIRRQNCVNAFLQLGFSDIEAYLGEYGQKGPFLLLEEGRISPDEFRREVRRHIPSPVSDSQIDRAFNAFITGISRERLQALRNLRAKGHRLYVISNTNPIMFEGFIADQFRKEGLSMANYFDGIVASYEAKCYKPDREIFDYTRKNCGIDGDETLFFDDSAANVEAARDAGFKAVHVPVGAEFTDILKQYLAENPQG